MPVSHWLPAQLTQVENRKATMCKAHIVVNKYALVIRATMLDRVRHSLHQHFIRPIEADYPAHLSSELLFIVLLIRRPTFRSHVPTVQRAKKVFAARDRHEATHRISHRLTVGYGVFNGPWLLQLFGQMLVFGPCPKKGSGARVLAVTVVAWPSHPGRLSQRHGSGIPPRVASLAYRFGNSATMIG